MKTCYRLLTSIACFRCSEPKNLHVDANSLPPNCHCFRRVTLASVLRLVLPRSSGEDGPHGGAKGIGGCYLGLWPGDRVRLWPAGVGEPDRIGRSISLSGWRASF